MPDESDESVYDRLQALGGGPRSTTSKTTTTDPDALLRPPPNLRDNPVTQPTLPLPSHTGSSPSDRSSDKNDPRQEPQKPSPVLRRSSTDKDSHSQVEDVNASIQDQVNRLSVAFEHFVRNFTPVQQQSSGSTRHVHFSTPTHSVLHSPNSPLTLLLPTGSTVVITPPPGPHQHNNKIPGLLIHCQLLR